MVVLIFVAFAIRTSWFQTYLAQQAATYLSKEWKTEVRIDKVDIKFLDLVDIEGVYVEDKLKDTLLYSEALHVNIGLLSLAESMVDIETVELTNATANIKKYKGDTIFNFQHIVDYFATEDEDTTSSDFKVDVQKVILSNVNFVYQDQNADFTEYGLDYSNLGIKNLSGEFSNFGFAGEQIGASIKNLHFKERSGLILTKLSADVTYNPEAIGLKNLRLGFNNSLLISDEFYLLTPNGTEDFSNFVHNVTLAGNIRDTKIDLTDIAYFVPTIQGMDAKINLNNTELKGAVYGLQLLNTDITLLDSTIIRGDFQIPDLDHGEVYFDDQVTLFQTTVADIQSLKLTPFLEGQDYLMLPASMAKAGLIKLRKSHVKGTLNDFTFNGALTSGLGNVYVENGLRFYKKSGEDIYYYNSAKKGLNKDLIVQNLDLEALSGSTMLGKTSGYLTIQEGSKGFSMDEIKVLFSGKFSQFELNNYNYQDITIKNGKYANDRFAGKIDIKDDNLAVRYDGWVDLKNDMQFKFNLEIDSANLSNLNFLSDSLKSHLETNLVVDIRGTDPNELSGSVKIEDFKYVENGTEFVFDQMVLDVARNQTNDSITIASELLDLELTGKFDLLDLWPVVQHQLARVADHIVEDVDISKTKNAYFDLKLELKDINPILNFVDTNLYVAQNSRVTSSYNLDDLKLTVDVSSDSVLYDGMRMEKIVFKSYFDSLRANVQFQMLEINVNDSLGVSNAALFSYVKNNEFSTNVGWDALGKVEPALFAFKTELKENKDIVTKFNPSFFFLKSHKWDIKPQSTFVWNNEVFEFTDFQIKNGAHFVELDGKVSKDSDDWLYFKVRDFDLTDLNGILNGSMELAGNVNIDGGVSDVYNNIRFTSNSDIDNLSIDGELVGDIIVDNKWNKETNSVSIDGNLSRDNKETFTFNGGYNPSLDKNNLDLDLIFDYTDIGFLSVFSDPELYTDIEGLLNGKLKITGELTDPIINGKLDVVTANVKVPMFNVTFGFSGGINFGPDEFVVDFMNVYDQEGNNAIASMQIYHYDWADWNYDITLDMTGPMVSERFLVMDTEYQNGDLYYGKAYISGDVNIFGYDATTEISVNATTKPGTDIKLAMYGTGDLEESSFIVFDTVVPVYDPNAEDNEDARIESSGLIMNMNFNITKDTRATIVFDPVYEDQIEIESGSGKLALNMDEYGEMTMRGDYTIYDGVYNMNVKGLAKRKFILEPASRLEWTQSPYDAIINIGAKYVTRTSLDPILPPGVIGTGEKTKVVAILNMRNTLLSPELSFDIDTPESGDLGNAAIAALDNDEMKKQFFALVALGRFLAINGNAGSGGNVGLGIAEDQVNAVLDKVSQNFDLDATIDDSRVGFGFETQVGEKITIKSSLGVVSGDDEHEGGLIGDVVIEYELNDDGSFTVNIFNESNQGPDAEKGPFTQGVGLHYEENFNTAREFKLLQKFLNLFRKQENKVDYKKAKDNGKMKSVEEALKERSETGN